MTKSAAAAEADWHSSIGYLLHESSRLLMRALREALEPYGMTVPQYFVMRNLWELKEPTQRELARRLGMEESRLALVLDTLEEAKLVVRRRSTIDRRKTQVVLTAAGGRLRYTLRDSKNSTLGKGLQQMLGGLSEGRVEELRESLKLVKANLEVATGRSKYTA